MPLTWIDGREIAKKWKENAAQRAQTLTEKGVTPHLAVIVAGDNPASQVYVRNKENACLRAGIRSTILRLPESCTQEELESAVVALNADQSVHGILVQLPLPKGLDEARVLALIDPEKDVDGFHAMNAGKLMSGQPGFVPCTPLGVMKLLEAYNIPTRGRHADGHAAAGSGCDGDRLPLQDGESGGYNTAGRYPRRGGRQGEFRDRRHDKARRDGDRRGH